MLLSLVELPRKLISFRYQGSSDDILLSNFGILGVPYRGIWNCCAIAGGEICSWLIGDGIRLIGRLRTEGGNRIGT